MSSIFYRKKDRSKIKLKNNRKKLNLSKLNWPKWTVITIVGMAKIMFATIYFKILLPNYNYPSLNKCFKCISKVVIAYNRRQVA